MEAMPMEDTANGGHYQLLGHCQWRPLPAEAARSDLSQVRAHLWMSNGGTKSRAHLDGNEVNLLMQIRGSKTIHLLPYTVRSPRRAPD